jgi:serine protease inhibitor
MAANSPANGWASSAALLGLLSAALLCGLNLRSVGAQPTEVTTAHISTPINDFGLRLLRTLTDGTGANVIVSPLSVSLALAMTYNGAAGDTRNAIAKTLGAGSLSDTDFNRRNRLLLDTIQKADPALQIEIANALWTQSGLPLSAEFVKLNQDYFDASVHSLDFASDPGQAADLINAWVKARTRGRIPEIIKTPSRTTVLVLTDAVYFKGRWSVPFDPKKTEPRTFHLQNGRSVTIPMMSGNGKYDYSETDSFQVIRLPYGGNRLAMYVFLPRRDTGLPDFMRSLDEPHWREWTRNLAERKGKIVLPRLESTYSRKLNGALKAMGMSVAFGPKADFSRVRPPPPAMRIDDVEHKTYVKVDEEGTEAAAATSVGVVAMAMRASPPPFEMVVDHPFFCAIAERRSDALLFAGVVAKPAPN